MDALLKFFANLGNVILKLVTREPAPPPPNPDEPKFEDIRDEEANALREKRNTKPDT